MDKLQELQHLINAGSDDVSVFALLFNFVGAIIVSFFVKEFYVRYSLSLTGKMHIGAILPILTGIIFLIIVVVKTSLALSLGLVGALSIVRFRTPIKEPEELVYLFLAIAIGLGFGAGFALITTVIVISLLLVTYFWLSNRDAKSSEYNLVINWENQDVSHDSITNAVKLLSSSLKLVRFENSPESNCAVFLLELAQESSIDLLLDKLNAVDENISVSFFESKVNW